MSYIYIWKCKGLIPHACFSPPTCLPRQWRFAALEMLATQAGNSHDSLSCLTPRMFSCTNTKENSLKFFIFFFQPWYSHPTTPFSPDLLFFRFWGHCSCCPRAGVCPFYFCLCAAFVSQCPRTKTLRLQSACLFLKLPQALPRAGEGKKKKKILPPNLPHPALLFFTSSTQQPPNKKEKKKNPTHQFYKSTTHQHYSNLPPSKSPTPYFYVCFSSPVLIIISFTLIPYFWFLLSWCSNP